MTVYELIKKLVEYSPDSQVKMIVDSDCECTIDFEDHFCHVKDYFHIYDIKPELYYDGNNVKKMDCRIILKNIYK